MPESTSLAASRVATRLRVALVSDQREVGHTLHDHFNVVLIPFAQAETELMSLRSDVVVVDAVGTPRLAEVSRLSLGGMRCVVVVGPPENPTDAMRYLDLGASDYVSSDASAPELAARVRAVARTAANEVVDDTLVCGPIMISLRRREVRRGSEVVHLTPNEFAILEVLARDAGSLVTHRQLTAAVWGGGLADARHYLRIYIRQLREKLEQDATEPALIQTEWGVGYRLVFDAPAERTPFATA